jgi:hypothetical protein
VNQKEDDPFLEEVSGLGRTKSKKKKRKGSSLKTQQGEKSHLFRYRTKAKTINQLIAEEVRPHSPPVSIFHIGFLFLPHFLACIFPFLWIECAKQRVNKGLTTPPPILTCSSAPGPYPATKYCSVCRSGSLHLAHHITLTHSLTPCPCEL